MSISEYEFKQMEQIRAWKAETPSVVSQVAGAALAPAVWLVNKVVPAAAIQGAIDASASIANMLTDQSDVLREAGVQSLSELRTIPLERLDTLANEVHNWAIGVAIAEGAATGAGGLIGIAVDIPAVITLALRTIHKVGVCYGFEVKTQQDREFVLGVLAGPGSRSEPVETVGMA